MVILHLVHKHIIKDFCSKSWYSFLNLNYYIMHFCFNYKQLFVSLNNTALCFSMFAYVDPLWRISFSSISTWKIMTNLFKQVKMLSLRRVISKIALIIVHSRRYFLYHLFTQIYLYFEQLQNFVIQENAT